MAKTSGWDFQRDGMLLRINRAGAEESFPLIVTSAPGRLPRFAPSGLAAEDAQAIASAIADAGDTAGACDLPVARTHVRWQIVPAKIEMEDGYRFTLDVVDGSWTDGDMSYDLDARGRPVSDLDDPDADPAEAFLPPYRAVEA